MNLFKRKEKITQHSISNSKIGVGIGINPVNAALTNGNGNINGNENGNGNSDKMYRNSVAPMGGAPNLYGHTQQQQQQPKTGYGGGGGASPKGGHGGGGLKPLFDVNGMPMSNDTAVTFSTIDFFDRFVRHASDQGLLKTPLPTPISRHHIRSASVQLLHAARLEASHVIIVDDQYGGTITVTRVGLDYIHGYLAFKLQSKAATQIQRIIRGVLVRTRITNYFKSNGLQLPKHLERKLLVSVDGHNPVHDPVQQQPTQPVDAQDVNDTKQAVDSLKPPTHDSSDNYNHRGDQNENENDNDNKSEKEFDASSVIVYEKYIKNISNLYHAILHAKRPTGNEPEGPSANEVAFIETLNNYETYQVCYEYLMLLVSLEKQPLKLQNRMTMMPGAVDQQDTLKLYLDYAPKIQKWLSQVLGIQFDPSQDLLFILRSGDILCKLTTVLYTSSECNLLDKGLEYGIHKIIFFLEFCKSLNIKRSLLFKVSDILVSPENDKNRKHALIVLRSIIALEKHARKMGWQGPVMGLKAKTVQGTEERVRDQDRGIVMANTLANPEPEIDLVRVGDRQPDPEERVYSTEETLQIERTQSNLTREKSEASKGEPEDGQEEGFEMGYYQQIQSQSQSQSRTIDSNENESKRDQRKTSEADTEAQASHFLGIGKFMDEPFTIDLNEKSNHDDDDHDHDNLPNSNNVELDNRDPNQNMKLILRDRKIEVEGFIEQEELFFSQIATLSEYISRLIKQRQHRSIETLEGDSFQHSRIGMEGGEERAIAGNFTLTANHLTPHKDETERAYKLRVENEIEELTCLVEILHRIKDAHGYYVEGLKTSWDFERGVFLVSETTSDFVNTIQSLYTSYAVSALSQNDPRRIRIHNMAELQESDAVGVKVDEFMITALGTRSPTMRSSDAGLSAAGLDEPTDQEWQYFLRRPLHRLTSYGKLFSKIHGPNKVNLDQGQLDKDNKRLQICGIRLECMANTIMDHLETYSSFVNKT